MVLNGWQDNRSFRPPCVVRRLSAMVLCFVFAFAWLARLDAGPAQERSADARQQIEAAAARRDFRMMQSIFSQAHATAFTQIPKPPLPELFPEKGKVDIRDFVTRILRYYRGIHVDHTGLGFSPGLIGSLGLKTALFPFPLKFFQGRAYFDCTYGDIPFGAELLKINGIAVSEILKRFNTVTAVLNDRGESDDYRLGEGFSFLYYMVEGPQSQWSILLQKGEAIHEVTVDTSDGSGKAFVPRQSMEQPNYAQPVYIMFNPQLKAAYLAINSFMPAGKELDSIESWNNMLFAFHREAAARKAENLVIDLRVNRGGVMLFSAAAAAWFIEHRLEDKSRSRTRSRVLPFREHVTAVNSMAASEQILRDTEEHLQKGFSDAMVGGYFETRESAARYLTLFPVEQAHRFQKIYLLVSSATYSAAVNFARLVRLGNTKAMIVGEETGSPGDGHSAEILVTYRLPGSGLLLEIPMVQVQFSPLLPGQQKNRGIKPDFTSLATPADFLSGRDGQLELVSEWMQQTAK